MTRKSRVTMDMKAFRLHILGETIQAFERFSYTPGNPDRAVTLDGGKLAEQIRRAKFYENASTLTREVVTEKQELIVNVVKGDCLAEGLRLKSQNYNPIVLNMASDINPGGGFRRGAGAQEENLFRRTNLYQYHEPKKEEWYPIPEFGGIYCPNATVIRSTEQCQYEWLEEPETISFVAVAALRRPKLLRTNHEELTLSPEDQEKTRSKIKSILNIGIENGHDAVVLSAFGCGAFGNPAATIAQLFFEVLKREYAGGENLPRTYRNVTFAIFDDSNVGAAHNPEGNLVPFQRRFENGLDGPDTLPPRPTHQRRPMGPRPTQRQQVDRPWEQTPGRARRGYRGARGHRGDRGHRGGGGGHRGGGSGDGDYRGGGGDRRGGGEGYRGGVRGGGDGGRGGRGHAEGSRVPTTGGQQATLTAMWSQSSGAGATANENTN